MLNLRKPVVSVFSCSAVVLLAAFTVGAIMPQATMADDHPAKAAPPPPPPPAATADDLPSPDKLLDAAIEAQGGQKAFEAIESIRSKGQMRMPMGSIDMETHFKSSGEFFIRQSNPMMGVVRIGFNGETGWFHQDQQGYRLLDADEVGEVRSMTMTHDMAHRLREEFRDMQTVGTTSFADRECYKVRMVHKKHEREQFTFFDVETKRIAGVEITEEGDFGPMTISVTFNGWEQRGDVTVFTKTIMSQMGMEMVMEMTEMEFNDVDDAVFELPEEVKKLAAERKEKEEQEKQEKREQEGSDG